MIELLIKIQSLIERALMVIACIAMATMMCAISADALGRYLFRHPIVGTYEVVSLYLMVIITFMAASGTYAAGSQVRMDILLAWLRRVTNGWIDRFNALIMAAGLGVLTYFTGQEALHKIAGLHTSFGVIQFPLYLSYVWVPLGCGVLTLRLILEMVTGPARAEQDPVSGDAL